MKLISINKYLKMKKGVYKMFHIKSNGLSGLDYRLNLYKDNEFIKKASFWHDIPYINEDSSYNMVVEIPKGNLQKFEMSTNETHNPIKQDVKRNKLTGQTYLRYYKHTPIFNYGFIPQTWENNKKLIFNKYYGDNDPIDIVELSDKRYHVGQIVRVRIVGGFCLIDEGEVDWKVLAINNDEDISHEESVGKIVEWFKMYKTFDGKEVNTIYEDKIFNADEMKAVVSENHEEYIKLIHSKL
jgi:inorganic pyrophosphatase